MVRPGELVVVQRGIKWKVRRQVIDSFTATFTVLSQVTLPDGPSRGCEA